MDEWKQIDDILTFLAKDDRCRGNVSDGELFKYLERSKINTENLHPILNKLERDKNIDTHINRDEIKKYAISFEGKLFERKGGYAKQISKEWQENLYKNTTTFALIFGGVAGGCYYIFDLLKWAHHHC